MILKDLLNLCFPKLCFGCDKNLLQQQQFLCVQCLHDLPFTNQHLYRENEAYEKFHGRLHLSHCSCMLYFTKSGYIQRLFHHLKYKNQPAISHYLGLIYASQLRDCDWLQTVDAIVAVPMHPKKRRARGYNQVEGFAQALSERFDIPIVNGLLTQEIHVLSQTKKSLFERTQVNKMRFKLHYQTRDHNKHYLLIDDILTTGGTLESCGKKLLEIPNSKLSILCLAQTQ